MNLALYLGFCLAVGIVCVECTSQQTKTAVDVAVTVTDALCKEEASDPAAPDWVRLACAIEGGVAHVVFPRTAWAAMHPRPIDRTPP